MEQTPEAKSESAEIAITTVHSVLVILNIAGNSLVCVIIAKNQEMRFVGKMGATFVGRIQNPNYVKGGTSINYLLLNLAVADMILGIFFVPRYILRDIFTHPDGVTGNVLCKFLTGGTCGWVGAAASVFTLIAIAIERYYAVRHPHGYKAGLSKRNIKVVIPCSWIFGVLLHIPWFLVMTVSEESGECSDMWPAKWMSKAYSMIWFLLVAVFPITLMAALYIRVVYTLWFKHGKPIQQPGVMKVRKRVTLMVVIISVIVEACYLTYSANYVMYVYYPAGEVLSRNIRSIMISFNSAINPFIYASVNIRFREKLKKMMCCTRHLAREPRDDRMEAATYPTHPTQEQDKSCME